nr:hypothetical protein [Bradyrhizobium sp. BRP22]
MFHRRRFIIFEILEQRLAEEAARLRRQVQDTRSDIEREQLIRRARQAEIGSHIREWLTSPGLQPPR